MTRALLEQAFEAWFDMQYEKDPDRSSLSSRDGWNAAIEYLAQQERKPMTEHCEWHPEDQDFMPDTYASTCGELWSFIDGGPIENRVKFCHGCGKPVILKESL